MMFVICCTNVFFFFASALHVLAFATFLSHACLSCSSFLTCCTAALLFRFAVLQKRAVGTECSVNCVYFCLPQPRDCGGLHKDIYLGLAV